MTSYATKKKKIKKNKTNSVSVLLQYVKVITYQYPSATTRLLYLPSSKFNWMICILVILIKNKQAGVKRAHILLFHTITYHKAHSNPLQCRPLTICCSSNPFKWFSKSHSDSYIPKEKWLGSSNMKLLYCIRISAINKHIERIGYTDFFCLSE